MPESLESQRYASFVCFGADVFDRVERSNFKEVFFPKEAAVYVANRDVAFVCFAEDLLPVGFAFF